MIKAIETHYNGYKFRSRLEARWAVFFDAAGIRYLYEDEGYILQPGDPEYCSNRPYLPDFYLPDFESYVEVKGSYELLDWDLLTDAVEYGNGLPGICDSDRATDGKVHSLIVLGQIPLADTSAVPIHMMVFHHKGAVLGTVDFDRKKVTPDWRGDCIAWGPPYNQKYWKGIFDGKYIEKDRTITPLLKRAYAKARAARFEFKD